MVKRMSERTVDDICRDIRDLANCPVFVQNIRRFDLNWDLVWAAMDMVEDTELAINSFEHNGVSSNPGAEYLKVYGLFQAMFMQQDAVRNFAEGFRLPEVNIADDTDAAEVREVRNKYFGHHKYRRNGVTTYHGIARMTVGSGSITAWTYPNFSTENIRLKDAIKVNQDYIEKALEEVLVNMKKKKSDFTKSITEKLSEDRQNYAFEKIYSWVYGNTADRAAMTGAGLSIVRESINKLEEGLRERYESLSGLGDVERTIKKARFALDNLDTLFADNPNGMDGDFNTEIYVDSLQSSFNELIDISKEINTEFADS